MSRPAPPIHNQQSEINNHYPDPLSEDDSVITNDFQYHPLLNPSTEIRLLVLLPSPDRSAPIECQLSTIASADPIPFEAVSYHWESPPTRDREISVNGKQLLITKSLESALRDLRRRTESRRLWADGICIDQSMEAITERGVQVTQMTQIFARAERVVAWLTEEDQNFLKVFAFIHDMARSPLGPAIIFDSFPGYESLDKLINLPWWTRVWVFQEIVAAKEAILVCGKAWLPLDIFQDAARNLLDVWTEKMETRFRDKTLHPQARRFVQRGNYHVRWSSWCEDLASKDRLRKRLQQGEAISLLEILSSQRGPFHGASDPRDRVFALTGLSSEHQELQRAYNTDYTQSIEEIYATFARSFIQVSGNMNMLSASRTRAWDSGSTLPSWVPDWRVGYGWEDLRRISDCQLFDAGGGTRCEVLETCDPRSLRIMGVKFDKIDWMLPTYDALDEFRALMLFLYGEFLPLEDLAHDPRTKRARYSDLNQEPIVLESLQYERFEFKDNRWPNGELPMDPFLYISLMVHDTWLESGVPRRLDESKTHLLCAHITGIPGLEWTIPLFLSASTPEDLEILADNLEILSPSDRSDIARNFKAIDNRLSMEMMIRTTGGYYAMVPKWANEGDIIVIPMGSSVPYVAREQDGHFILIREAYVPDIMDGEVFEEYVDGESTLDILDIR